MNDHGFTDNWRDASVIADMTRTTVAYSGDALQQLNRVNFELTNIFNDAGFQPIEPSILQSADPLFHLYGEDIWDRACIVESAGQPSLCIRPDFTVPVAQAFLHALAHQNQAATSARYGYFGPVFRNPQDRSAGASQHLQAGVEIIGEGDPSARDAEVFQLTLKALKWCGCERFDVVTGDLGVVFSLLDALTMPESWRRRLKRHFWRPRRFQELLRRFAGPGSPSVERRRAFLKGVGALCEDEAVAAIAEAIALSETPHIGVRSEREVVERLLRQAADAREQPLSDEVVSLIDAVLSVKAPSTAALSKLRDIVQSAQIDLSDALNRMAERLDAMNSHGVDIYNLQFDASFGRNLEYYDGFVFEMTATIESLRWSERVKLGGGGRYDRLFTALGAPQPLTGIGAALRPEAIVAAAKNGSSTGGVGAVFEQAAS